MKKNKTKPEQGSVRRGLSTRHSTVSVPKDMSEQEKMRFYKEAMRLLDENHEQKKGGVERKRKGSVIYARYTTKRDPKGSVVRFPRTMTDEEARKVFKEAERLLEAYDEQRRKH